MFVVYGLEVRGTRGEGGRGGGESPVLPKHTSVVTKACALGGGDARSCGKRSREQYEAHRRNV